MLHAFGARTVVDAIDGADALEKFATHQPDVVILDWVLPVIDGIEVLRFMRNRKDSRNPYVPVIMLSAYGERPAGHCCTRRRGHRIPREAGGAQGPV